MKKLIFSAFIFCASLTIHAQDFDYAEQVGGTESGMDMSFSVANAPNGDVYYTACFRNTVDFDPGPGVVTLTNPDSANVFVQKLDSSGNFLWVREFKGIGVGESQEYVVETAVDAAGAIYILGGMYDTINANPDTLGTPYYLIPPAGQTGYFVIKLDAGGNLVWADAFTDDTTLLLRSLTVDNSSNVYLTGAVNDTVDVDPGPGVTNLPGGIMDGLLIKLDPSGNLSWAETFGTNGTGGCTQFGGGNSIKVDASGNIFIGGIFCDNRDFDPGAGVYTMTGDSYTEVSFFLKLNNTGAFVSAVKIIDSAPVSGDIELNKITLDTAGNVYGIGEFIGNNIDFNPGGGTFLLTSSSSYNVYTIKLDNALNFVWANTFGGTGYDMGGAIDNDGGNGIFITGWFRNTADLDPDPVGTSFETSPGIENVYVIKLNLNGDLQWYETPTGHSSAPYSVGYSISADGFQNVYTAGSLWDTLDFDPGVDTTYLTGVQYGDGFMWKF